MRELASVTWPPAPIRTERLVLRAPKARDRTRFIDLLASSEVHVYLGGPRPRAELEREMPGVPVQRAGLFVIELDGEMIGMVELKPYGLAGQAGSRPDVAKAELGYLILPDAWGRGYGAEACAAALGWFADERPGEPVVLRTQTANKRSMNLAAKLGFSEVELFWAFDAEQWLGVWSPATPSA